MEQTQEKISERAKNQAYKAGKQARKGFFRIIFSRTGIILILIALQLLFFVVTANFLSSYQTYIYGITTAIGLCVVIYIYNSSDNPAFKMTWILFVMVFPVFTSLFYVYTRLQIGVRRMRNRLNELQKETAPYMKQQQDVKEAFSTSRSANKYLASYLDSVAGFPTYRNTEVKYYPLGEDMFADMVRELKKAQDYIFMEYFIVEEGYMWDTILDILKKKAAAGVEVRFMYDGMNAINRVPYNYADQIRKYFIKCKVSNPVRPFLSTVQNNRDHRKICVIDGKVGFTGGVNLADEYINKTVRFGHWKDTAVMLKGDAVQSLTMMFLQMWNVEGKKGEENFKRYCTKPGRVIRRELGYVIPYGDSPFDNENVGEEVYFHILNHAKKYVHIMTPYLILDYEMTRTLKRAAESGIEVIILMPGIPDKWYAYALGKTYYKELLQSGVKIYEYTPGFVHAKVFVSDDDTATVGSVNLDFRSLYLHFECGAYIYNNSAILDIEQDFQDTLTKSHEVTLKDVQNRSLRMKLAGQILRLVAPLM